MNESVARLAGVSFVLMLVASLIALFVFSRGSAGPEVRAEFRDAFPLLEGMSVRMSGAIAGSVEKTELTDRGTALVTMQLHNGLEPPRRDASVSVRQSDLLGDSYVSLSAGADTQPLEATIPVSRATSAPRLDDALGTFREPVAQSLGLLVNEVGVALERRGEDLNAALAHLRPTLVATDDLLAELDTQNATLRELITSSERVGGQAARRSRDIGPVLDGLATTLRTVADRRPELDRGLERMPATLAQTEGTLVRLRRVTDAAHPLSVALRRAAPDLETAARLLPPFVDDAQATIADLRPTARLARGTLAAAEPTLDELAGALPSLRRLVPPLAELVDRLGPLADELSDAFFGAESYGVGPGRRDDVGAGASAVQRPEADSDPARRNVRIVPVFSCESFGRPIEPGCLDEVLDALPARAFEKTSARAGRARDRGERGERPGEAARRDEQFLEYLLGP